MPAAMREKYEQRFESEGCPGRSLVAFLRGPLDCFAVSGNSWRGLGSIFRAEM